MNNLEIAFKESLLLKNDDKLLDFIIDKKNIAKDLIDIYRNNYCSNLLNSLSITFPTIRKLIGKACFKSLVMQYIIKYPPKESNLINYGSNFSSYVGTVEKLKKIHYLQDIAKLDYLMNKVYHSSNEEDLNISSIKLVGSKDFKLKNCIEFIQSKHPIDFIYNYCHTKQKTSKVKTLPLRGVKLAILRKHYKVKYIKLYNYEINFLLDLKRLGKLSSVLNSYHVDKTEKIQKVLLKILSLKLLTYL